MPDGESFLSTSVICVLSCTFRACSAAHRGDSTVGDVLLAAAFVSYAGAFSKDYRQELWRNRCTDGSRA